jgi:transcriptional regulator with XRE-family HTH domain
MQSLKELRIRKGFGVNQLSRLSGVNPAIISQLEAGKRKRPMPTTMMLLSNALGVDILEVSEFRTFVLGKEQTNVSTDSNEETGISEMVRSQEVPGLR